MLPIVAVIEHTIPGCNYSKESSVLAPSSNSLLRRSRNDYSVEVQLHSCQGETGRANSYYRLFMDTSVGQLYPPACTHSYPHPRQLVGSVLTAHPINAHAM